MSERNLWQIFMSSEIWTEFGTNENNSRRNTFPINEEIFFYQVSRKYIYMFKHAPSGWYQRERKRLLFTQKR